MSRTRYARFALSCFVAFACSLCAYSLSVDRWYSLGRGESTCVTEVRDKDGEKCGSWLTDYTKMHSLAAKKLKAGKPVQLLVYSCQSGCGGLGDRLSGMLSAFFVAVSTQRVFVIDHANPFPLRDTLLPNSIDWDLAAFVQASFDSTTVHLIDTSDPMVSFGSIMKAHLTGVTVVRVQLNRYFVAMALWTPRTLLQVPSGEEFAFVGRLYESHVRFCSDVPRTKSTFKIAFHHLFRFAGAVLTRSEGMYKELEFNSSSKYIGLHARLGGRVEGSGQVLEWEDPTRHGMGDLPIFLNCAKSKNFGRWGIRGVVMPLLVISDSSEFKEASERISGATYVKSTMLFHIDRSIATNTTLLAQGNIDTYAELLLLSRATCIVGSHSGFSGVAAAISDENEPRCFCMFDDCSNEDFDFFESTERSQVRF